MSVRSAPSLSFASCCREGTLLTLSKVKPRSRNGRRRQKVRTEQGSCCDLTTVWIRLFSEVSVQTKLVGRLSLKAGRASASLSVIKMYGLKDLTRRRSILQVFFLHLRNIRVTENSFISYGKSIWYCLKRAESKILNVQEAGNTVFGGCFSRLNGYFSQTAFCQAALASIAKCHIFKNYGKFCRDRSALSRDTNFQPVSMWDMP